MQAKRLKLKREICEIRLGYTNEKPIWNYVKRQYDVLFKITKVAILLASVCFVLPLSDAEDFQEHVENEYAERHDSRPESH